MRLSQRSESAISTAGGSQFKVHIWIQSGPYCSGCAALLLGRVADPCAIVTRIRACMHAFSGASVPVGLVQRSQHRPLRICWSVRACRCAPIVHPARGSHMSKRAGAPIRPIRVHQSPLWQRHRRSHHHVGLQLHFSATQLATNHITANLVSNWKGEFASILEFGRGFLNSSTAAASSSVVSSEGAHRQALPKGLIGQIRQGARKATWT